MATFTFDPYEGMTDEELRERCRHLSRTANRYGIIIAMLVEYNDNAVALLPADYAATATRLNAAYRADASTPTPSGGEA